MATLDRLSGQASETGLAIKAPVAAATTGSNILLSGIQTIDGVSVGSNSERVLVKDQTDATTNGIYIASSGDWTRALDAAGNTDWTHGTVVYVAAGANNVGQQYRQTTDAPVTIGSSHLSFTADYTFPISVSQIAPLATPTADGAQFLAQNGTKSAYAIYGPAAPAGAFVHGNIRSVIDIESGMDVQNYCAYDGYIWNNVVWNPASVPHSHAGVGMEIYCVNAVAGAASFGFNPAFTDSYDATAPHSVASIMVAGEADFSTYNAGSSVTGWSFVIQGSVQPAGATVFDILRNNAMAAQWTNGFVLEDGALIAGGAGVYLGVQGLTPTAATQASGSFIFGHTDTAATAQKLTMQVLPNGVNNSNLALSNPNAPNGFFFLLSPTGTPATIYGAASDGLAFNAIMSAALSTTTRNMATFKSATYSATPVGQTVTNAATVAIENAPAAGTHVTITNAYALWVQAGITRLDGALYNGSNQVVTARQTGWTVMTGTPQRGTFATGSVTLAQLAGVVMALEQDLITHGLIGT
jgi:hypothetical protein